MDINVAGGEGVTAEIVKSGGKAIFVKGDCTSEDDASLFALRVNSVRFTTC